MSNATKTQQKYLRAIADYTRLNGYPPTIAGLAALLDVCTGTAQHALTRLSDGELVTWSPNRRRTLKLTELGKTAIDCIEKQD